MQKLAKIKHLALDLDGTLYLGKRLFPFTLPFLDGLKRLRLGRTFFTNNSSTSTRGYVDKLCRESGVKAVDARSWMPDGMFFDGHHLLPAGAVAFSWWSDGCEPEQLGSLYVYTMSKSPSAKPQSPAGTRRSTCCRTCVRFG